MTVIYFFIIYFHTKKGRERSREIKMTCLRTRRKDPESSKRTQCFASLRILHTVVFKQVTTFYVKMGFTRMFSIQV